MPGGIVISEKQFRRAERRLANKSKSTKSVKKAQLKNSETKFAKIEEDAVSVGSSWVYHRPAIPQDLTQQGRIGNRITTTGLFLRLLMRWNTAATTGTLIRVIAGFRKQGYSATPLSGIGFTNLPDLDQLNVIHDKIYNVDTYRQFFYLNLRRKYKRGKQIRYTGAGDTTVVNDDFFIGVISNDNTNQPTLTLHGRYYYKDI